jgi:hypothetical protein
MDLLEGLQPNKSTPQHVNQVLVCFHFGLTGQTDMLMTSQPVTNTYVCVSTPQHVNQVLVCFHFGLTGQTDMLMTSKQGTNTYVCVSTPQHVNQVLVFFHFGLTGQTDMLMTSQQGTNTFCMCINTSTCKSGFSMLSFWFNRRQTC